MEGKGAQAAPARSLAPGMSSGELKALHGPPLLQMWLASRSNLRNDPKQCQYHVMQPTDTQIWRASVFVLTDTLVSQGVSALVPTLFLIMVTYSQT